MDSKDNYFNLRKLYLLLHKDNLLANEQQSKTESILSRFREEQRDITKEFYEKYKKLRVELINDIKRNNKDIQVDIVIEKAQKIIDRLIFIFFCEDKGLLPDKKLKANIIKIKEVGLNAWDAIKAFFENINT
jgi:hypothetical protein